MEKQKLCVKMYNILSCKRVDEKKLSINVRTIYFIHDWSTWTIDHDALRKCIKSLPEDPQFLYLIRTALIKLLMNDFKIE